MTQRKGEVQPREITRKERTESSNIVIPGNGNVRRDLLLNGRENLVLLQLGKMCPIGSP